MKRFILLSFFLLITFALSFGQEGEPKSTTNEGCSGGTQYPTSVLNPTTSWQSQTQIYAGEYSVHNVTSGNTYTWSLCSSDGANAPYDSQLTLRNHSNGALIAYSDDDCGDDAKIVWTANITGQVRVLVNEYNCQANSINTTLRYIMETSSSTGCTGGTQYPTNILNPTTTWQTQSNIYAGEYSVHSVTAGNIYTWSLCTTDGGDASYDSQLTLLNHTNGSIITYSDDACGNDAKIVWTATFTGNVRVLVTQYNCQSNSISTTLAYVMETTATNGCSGGTQYPTTTLTPDYEWKTSAGMYAGEYGLFNVESGKTYIWSLCSTDGGSCSYDSEITLIRNSDLSIIDYNDDYCGNIARIEWQANFTGLIRVLVTQYNCQSNAISTTLAYRIEGSAPTEGCSGGTQYPSNTLTPTIAWQTQTQLYAGEYSLFNVDAGETYIWSLCENDGGSASYDSEITLINDSNEQFIAYNDNYCGDDARIVWTATYTGQVRVLITEYECQSNSSATTLAYIKLSGDQSLCEALDNCNLEFNSSGFNVWFAQTDISQDGVSAAQSGAIGNYEYTIIYTTITGPGTLSFWWKVSSEQIYDRLEFHINDVTQDAISGDIDWLQMQYDIPEGTHTLTWKYVKDGSISQGLDCGFVDQVVYQPEVSTPVIQTLTVTSITPISAVSGGNITEEGDSPVTSRGVVWSTTFNPTLEDNVGYTQDGDGTGSFTSQLTGLSPQTLYYVRAYAVNEAGTGYGNSVSFQTEDGLPVLSTIEVTVYSSTLAVSGGNITDDSGFAVTSRGIVWGTASEPTLGSNDGLTTDGSGIGEFTSTMANLNPQTNYYVRAYASNSNGTKYGNEVLFTTLPTSIEGNLMSNVSIYPNPFNDKLVIDSETPVRKISISNMNGQTVLERTFNGTTKTSLDVSNLSNGFYIITIEDSNGNRINQKVVK